MSNNIVYLLGAGASYNCIPVVAGMTSRMRRFLHVMKDKYKDHEHNYELEKYNDIIAQIEFHGTPDIYAKNLSDRRDSKLHYLKYFLTCFLIFEQLEKGQQAANLLQSRMTSEDKDLHGLNETIDKRYLSFFPKITQRVNNTIKLNSTVSFITWNYDMQIERAFQEITLNDFRTVQHDLNVYPSIAGDYNGIDTRVMNEFSVIRLNGFAGLRTSDLQILFDPKNHTLDDDSLNIMMNILTSRTHKRVNLLKFAWEKDNEELLKAKEFAKSKINAAKTLVVIGYSFPDFNRELDIEIFGNEDLLKIYVQDPNAKSIIEKLEMINEGFSEIAKPITDTSEFILTKEYWENLKNKDYNNYPIY
jgi:hypothetical protein